MTEGAPAEAPVAKPTRAILAKGTTIHVNGVAFQLSMNTVVQGVEADFQKAGIQPLTP